MELYVVIEYSVRSRRLAPPARAFASYFQAEIALENTLAVTLTRRTLYRMRNWRAVGGEYNQSPSITCGSYCVIAEPFGVVIECEDSRGRLVILSGALEKQ